MQPYFPLHQLNVPVLPSAARTHTPITAMDATARDAQTTRLGAQKKALREAALVRNVAHNMRFAQANMALLAAQQNELARQGAQITHPLFSPALPGNTYGQPPGFLERGLNNPWAVFGANLMSAGDPTGQGLGPLGDAMLATRAHMQRQALQDEYRQLQHYGMGMKVRAANQQYAQRQAEQERMARFRETLPPDEQARFDADPAAYIATDIREAGKAAHRQPTMSDVQRVYDALGGLEGTGKTINQFYEEDYKSGGTTVNVGSRRGPVSPGYQEVTDPQGRARWEPIPGSPQAKPPKEEANTRALMTSLSDLEGMIREYGTEMIPSATKDDMQTLYNTIKLDLKEAKNLGVLSGNDEQILEGILPDPTALGSQAISRDRYLARIDRVRKMLQDRIDAGQGGGSQASPNAGAYPQGRTGRNRPRTSRTDGWSTTESGARWKER